MSCGNCTSTHLPEHFHPRRLRDPELADWVNQCIPDSIVDRVTPTTRAQAAVRDRFGIDHRSPVIREPCTQWVLQDAFAAGRPPFETPKFANPTAFIATVTFSVTWPTMSASSPPTGPPWPHCMSGGHG